ncbi:MAG TPA: hypothetical protein VFE71_07755 [Bacteroidales bacterium]|nr:hypothetical protein [Bacteroidales bacterium]
MMKKTLRYLTMLTVVTLLAVSCTKTDTTFDQSLLTGKWQSGTLFYKYAANGTGATWDTSDNVTEAEAQAFTWTLVKDLLTQIHTIEIGGAVPKVYTVTELTATSLKYHDDFGVSWSFTKLAQ